MLLLIYYVRNYAERVSFVHVLVLLQVRAELKVKKNKACWKTSPNLERVLSGLPRQRCVTGRGNRGGGTARHSSPLRSAAMAPGRGGGPLPEPGCCSLLPGAQKHPSGKRLPIPASVKEEVQRRTVSALHLIGLWRKQRVTQIPLRRRSEPTGKRSRRMQTKINNPETCVEPGVLH